MLLGAGLQIDTCTLANRCQPMRCQLHNNATLPQYHALSRFCKERPGSKRLRFIVLTDEAHPDDQQPLGDGRQ